MPKDPKSSLAETGVGELVHDGLAEVGAQRGRDACRAVGVVDGERIVLGHRDLRRPRRARGCGLGLDDPPDGVQYVGADLLVERADVELEQCLLGDHVVLGAGLQRADRDDRRLAGGDFARDDRLQAQDGRGGHDDGVDA